MHSGKAWGFIEMEPMEKLWHLAWEEKRGCLGHGIRPVGGRNHVLEDVDAKDLEILDSTQVPFVWHGVPLKFLRELVQVNNAVGIVDSLRGMASWPSPRS